MDKVNKKKSFVSRCFIDVCIIIAILGILAAISKPSYLRPGPKTWQSEARVNLSSIAVAQLSYFEETGQYATHTIDKKCFELIGWAPGGYHSSYSYYCDTDKIESKNHRGECPDPPLIPISGNSFTVIAIGNIDRDATCDVWYVNDTRKLWNMKMLKDGRIVEGSDLDDKSFLDRLWSRPLSP